MFSFVLDTKGHSLRDGEWQICAADLCYCDLVFVAEERASEMDDVGKAQKLKKKKRKKEVIFTVHNKGKCNVVSGWEDAEWKRNFRFGRPTTSLCFFFRAFIFSRHCVNVRLVPGLLEFLRDLSVRHLISRHST